MLLARISFIPQFDHEEPELTAIAHEYLNALLKNGQISGEYVIGWTEGYLEAYVHAAHRDVLHTKYHSAAGRTAENWVAQQFGLPPETEVLDDDASLPVPTLNSAKSLFLFAASLRDHSPLMHGSRGTPLPLPLLPISDGLREDLFVWQRRFQHAEALWIDTDALEDAAEAQLTAIDSPLMQEARRLAGEVERAVERPVYTYLLRFRGTDRATEGAALCPDCGGSWYAAKGSAPSMEPFYRFHYRCEPCRLVSHVANVFDGERNGNDEASPSPAESPNSTSTANEATSDTPVS